MNATDLVMTLATAADLKPGAVVEVDIPNPGYTPALARINHSLPKFIRSRAVVTQTLPKHRNRARVFFAIPEGAEEPVRVEWRDEDYGRSVLVEKTFSAERAKLRAELTRRANAVPHQWVTLVGGPFAGQRLLVSDPTGSTLPIHTLMWQGVYRLKRDEKGRMIGLHWEPV